jgi:hypothetical protein
MAIEVVNCGGATMETIDATLRGTLIEMERIYGLTPGFLMACMLEMDAKGMLPLKLSGSEIDRIDRESHERKVYLTVTGDEMAFSLDPPEKKE